MKNLFVMLTACLVAGLSGCGPAGSSEGMKNLQARVDVVLRLRAIHEEKKLAQSDIAELDSYADQVLSDDAAKQAFHALTENLWRKRTDDEEIERLTRELAASIELPEKYAKAYAF